MMDFDKLKLELMSENFDSKQWKEIKAICEINLGSFTAKESVTNFKVTGDYEVIFYNSLKSILWETIGMELPAISIYKLGAAKQFKELQKVAAELYKISCKWNIEKRRKRAFTIGVYYLYITLVIDYLEGYKVPVSIKSILQHVDKFEGIVDRAYPDYITSGMISVIVFRSKILQ